MTIQLILGIILIISLLVYFYMVFKDLKIYKEIAQEFKKYKEPLPDKEVEPIHLTKEDLFSRLAKIISEKLWGKSIEQTKKIMESYDYELISEKTLDGYKYLLFYSRFNGGFITVFEFDPDYPSYKIFRTCAKKLWSQVEALIWLENFISSHNNFNYETKEE